MSGGNEEREKENKIQDSDSKRNKKYIQRDE